LIRKCTNKKLIYNTYQDYGVHSTNSRHKFKRFFIYPVCFMTYDIIQLLTFRSTYGNVMHQQGVGIMTVLKDLYYGNIQPCDSKQSTEVRRKISAMNATEEKLMEDIPDNAIRAEVLEAFNKQTELIALCERDAFIDGFRLGARLIIETLTAP